MTAAPSPARLSFGWHSLLNGIVLSAVIAAALPTLLIESLHVLDGSSNGVQVLVLTVAAAIIGGLVGLVTYWTVFRALEATLQGYVTALEQAAAGDLRVRLTPPQSSRGFSMRLLTPLANQINALLERIAGIVEQMHVALVQLTQDSTSILTATSRQITSAGEQDTAVTEITATVNEVRATVTETAERASSVAETAQHSVDISKRGDDAVAATISGMDVIRRRVEDIADNILVLSEHTQQIGEIIATVNSLADQSRMLALNASVEAARAGEEGKGFAVVAMEVRSLADQNREATVQVREILGEIQRATNNAVIVTEEGNKGVDDGQRLVNRAGESIRELAKAIEEAAIAAMQIAASTRQQAVGVEQLTRAMRTIKNVTADTLTSTMQVEASAHRLQQAAQGLAHTLSGLRV
ncbi:MAG: methyl-accepting chemotaxis protein [Phototrophicaceae bacterium]|jgi:methyl-accepting chemotaxis protein